MPVGVADVHLAHVPGHVRRRPGHLEPLRQTSLVDRIDVFDPDRHPHTFVSELVAFRSEGRHGWTPAAPALTVLAEEDLALPRADAAERWRIAPFPSLRPPQLLEPREALLNVGDVQNRSQAPGEHAATLRDTRMEVAECLRGGGRSNIAGRRTSRRSTSPG